MIAISLNPVKVPIKLRFLRKLGLVLFLSFIDFNTIEDRMSTKRQFVDKSKAAKLFIDNYYSNLLQRIAEREKRYK